MGERYRFPPPPASNRPGGWLEKNSAFLDQALRQAEAEHNAPLPTLDAWLIHALRCAEAEKAQPLLACIACPNTCSAFPGNCSDCGTQHSASPARPIAKHHG
jgi:hypothetical protein